MEEKSEEEIMEIIEQLSQEEKPKEYINTQIEKQKKLKYKEGRKEEKKPKEKIKEEKPKKKTNFMII